MISSNIRTITDDGYAIVACVSMRQHHRTARYLVPVVEESLRCMLLKQTDTYLSLACTVEVFLTTHATVM